MVDKIKSPREKYEASFAEYTHAAGARAFAHGRHALVVLLKALGVVEGDRIGVCGYTCVSVLEAVKVSGAVPVYLDVDKYLCIDPDAVRRQGHGQIKVVILQHTFGVPGQLEELLRACSDIGAEVIEDCAHSLGCFWNGKPLGTFGSGAIYSSEWGKPYTTGQGGVLTVNSLQLLEKVDAVIRSLSSPPLLWNQLILAFERFIYPILGKGRLRAYTLKICGILRGLNHNAAFSAQAGFQTHLLPGYVRLMDNWTARAGLRRLCGWPRLMQLRRENAAAIEKEMTRASLPLWPIPEEAEVTLLMYPVKVTCKTEALRQARENKLDVTVWYETPVFPLYGDDLMKAGYNKGICPQSESMINNLVYLPTGKSLTRSKLAQTMTIIANLQKMPAKNENRL